MTESRIRALVAESIPASCRTPMKMDAITNGELSTKRVGRHLYALFVTDSIRVLSIV